jgi:hypothetical protein
MLRCYLSWSGLKLLLKFINRETTSADKRRSLAKDLAKIHMDVDDIVSRDKRSWLRSSVTSSWSRRAFAASRTDIVDIQLP